MKNRPLYAVFQDRPSHTYWATNIHEGICDAARDFGDTICPIELDALPPDLKSQNVLLVGNSQRWLKSTMPILIQHGTTPIIVNASMISDRSFRCSGVVFELEETLDRCMDMLKSAGRKHTVLLGLSQDSVTDHAKAEAFAQPANTVWAQDTLDACIRDFVDGLEKSNCDSVICANDTAAITLIRRLLEKNVSLPDRLYIIGMGNSYLGAGLALPLTSIMFDYREMGAEAVRLYHRLSDRKTDAHITVSLPCHLVIRESAPLTVSSTHEHAEDKMILPAVSRYFSEEETQNVIQMESIFQSGDAIDREILFGIARGERSDELAERLFFTDRAVRYRISKMTKRNNFQCREELEKALKRAILFDYRRKKEND